MPILPQSSALVNTSSKRDKDRYTILSQQCLGFLRDYWRKFRPNHPKGLLFPGWRNLSGITGDAVNEALKKWLAVAGICVKMGLWKKKAESRTRAT